jgi:methylmalonyl-CoA mutase
MLAQFTDRGLTPAQVTNTLAFSFGIGSEYFLEIAKLRAARALWARVLESFQPGLAGKVEVRIFARTSHWTKTIYDPHMNLLRSTTESMAAVIGGADALEVEPFDDTYREPSEFARRLARNTQLILKKEAWLDRVVDPAGGSYYVESLTDSLAREAWKLLQEIEGAGGFLNFRATGALERKAAADQHSASIVGTNRYPDLAERALPRLEREDPLPRAASAFEQIRLHTERYAASTGHTPRLLLLEAGDAKTSKARAAYAADFFGSAGFAIETSNAISGDPDAIVLCCSDAEYGTTAAKVTEALRLAGKPTPVIKAGGPEDGVDVLRALETHLGMEG